MAAANLSAGAFALASVAACTGVFAQTPFATTLIDYSPAPGQWVNDPNFNNSDVALGRPYAGGFDSSGASSLVSLGGFGGSLMLGFDHTVLDDPLNPFGMDAIVFGNAFWVSQSGSPDPNVHWAECATIEISFDANGNGEADDQWYLIPGSHIPDPFGQFGFVTWDDNVNDETYPPEHERWIPPGVGGVWSTGAYELPFDIFGPPRVVNPESDPNREGIYGYAEYSPTAALAVRDAANDSQSGMAAEDFYTLPDDPLTVGRTKGSAGGDAFDIAWAINPDTGLPADLPGFDFIRLTTAVNAVDVEGETLEKSAEIDAVADVAPDTFGDFDDDGDIDLLDFAEMQSCFLPDEAVDASCALGDRQPDGVVNLADAAVQLSRLTGPR